MSYYRNGSLCHPIRLEMKSEQGSFEAQSVCLTHVSKMQNNSTSVKKLESLRISARVPPQSKVS